MPPARPRGALRTRRPRNSSPLGKALNPAGQRASEKPRTTGQDWRDHARMATRPGFASGARDCRFCAAVKRLLPWRRLRPLHELRLHSGRGHRPIRRAEERILLSPSLSYHAMGSEYEAYEGKLGERVDATEALRIGLVTGGCRRTNSWRERRRWPCEWRGCPPSP